jgi:hypothetical protein
VAPLRARFLSPGLRQWVRRAEEAVAFVAARVIEELFERIAGPACGASSLRAGSTAVFVAASAASAARGSSA